MACMSAIIAGCSKSWPGVWKCKGNSYKLFGVVSSWSGLRYRHVTWRTSDSLCIVPSVLLVGPLTSKLNQALYSTRGVPAGKALLPGPSRSQALYKGKLRPLKNEGNPLDGYNVNPANKNDSIASIEFTQWEFLDTYQLHPRQRCLNQTDLYPGQL